MVNLIVKSLKDIKLRYQISYLSTEHTDTKESIYNLKLLKLSKVSFFCGNE